MNKIILPCYGKISRIFIIVLLFGLTIGAEEKNLKQRPNVVFILADDLGWRDLSNEGSVFYESPNIDKIANGGMKFTRGYAASSVCSPSRASILTGKYPTKHGVVTWIGCRATPEFDQNLRQSEVTIAEAFRSAGYKTFFAGKWHLGRDTYPTDNGFEINKGGWDAGGPRGGYFSPYKNPQLKDGPKGESLPVRLGRETASFIEANKEKPFFAYLSFYSVHSPIQTTEKLWNKYRKKAIKAEADLTTERFKIDTGIGQVYYNRQVQDCPVYAGLIEQMDEAVGLVLKKLDKLELTENTIICFTSDNGGVSSGDNFSTSNLPLRGGKGHLLEGGIREPFYIKAPRFIKKPGTKSSVPVSGIDWYPSLLDLCGISIPKEQDIDGVSFAPVLKGEKIVRRALFWHHPYHSPQGGTPASVIMQDGWKLIHYHAGKRDELYNLNQDVSEQKDLTKTEPARAKAMRALLNTWLKNTGAKFPRNSPVPDKKKIEGKVAWLKNKLKLKLESTHAKYLEESYKPNGNWWGSSRDN